MFSRLLPLVLLPTLSGLVAAAAELRVHHRIVHPSLPASPYVERATLHISGSGPSAAARLVPSEAYADDLRQLASSAEGLKDALYQVALERPGDADEAQWATSSVLAVSLPCLRPASSRRARAAMRVPPCACRPRAVPSAPSPAPQPLRTHASLTELTSVPLAPARCQRRHDP